MRCLLGLGDLLLKQEATPLAVQALTQLIQTYPSHPQVPHALALRSYAAECLGNWDLCVSDARAFLAKPVTGSFAVARCHLVLGKDAYRKGDLTTASTEFETASQLAQADSHANETSDVGGQAQAGLAAIAQDHGDLQGAMQCLLKGADLVKRSDLKATCLYQAAGLAEQLHDDTTRTQIIMRMTNEVPGSDLTSKLVGHELVAVREP